MKALSLWFRGHPGSVGSFSYTGTDPKGPYEATMTGSGWDIEVRWTARQRDAFERL